MVIIIFMKVGGVCGRIFENSFWRAIFLPYDQQVCPIWLFLPISGNAESASPRFRANVLDPFPSSRRRGLGMRLMTTTTIKYQTLLM